MEEMHHLTAVVVALSMRVDECEKRLALAFPSHARSDSPNGSSTMHLTGSVALDEFLDVEESSGTVSPPTGRNDQMQADAPSPTFDAAVLSDWYSGGVGYDTESEKQGANGATRVYLQNKSETASVATYASKGTFFNAIRHLLTAEVFDEEAVSVMFKEANTTKVKESAWDLTLFIFYPPLGLGPNIMVLLCVSFNSLLQLSFTYLVAGFIAFSNENLGDLAVDFEKWRDAASSGVQAAVCESSFSWGSDYKQLDTYVTFKEYTTHRAGLILCVAVCAAWSLSVLKVVGEVLDQVKALWYLADRDCKIMEISVVDKGFLLERLPTHRFGFYVVMCSIELLIACTLLVAGIVWLGSTTDIVELILNGAALAYIMDIDELIYHVLVPTKLSALIRLMRPLAVNWSMAVPARSLLLSIPFVVIVAVGHSIIIRPHLEGVLVVQQALCR